MGHCVACFEPIRDGAHLCPRCGTAQVRNRWKSIGQAVKWAGGAVTVISLSMGVLTLGGVYSDWSDGRKAIAEHVDAAGWLIRTGHYPQAWQTLSEASELSPSAPGVRSRQFELAQIWLRDFSAERASAGETLDQLTAVLYRRLSGAHDDEVADILAHVARAEILRGRFDLPSFVNVDTLFVQALAASPHNGYANAFLGNWRLSARGIGAAEIALAQQNFRIALDADLDRDLVRRLQLGPLANLSYGRSDDTECAALAALLKTGVEMMRASEPRPARAIRFKILDGYGVMGRGRHVETLVKALPPGDHRAVNSWLRDGLEEDGRPRMLTQARYLAARLTEAEADTAVALVRYRELLDAEHTTDSLDGLVNVAIERLTGELPARALARKYIHDPIDTSAPWAFHVDTLLHFDPMFQPRNLDEALKFFTVAVARKDRRIPDLLPSLDLVDVRVRAVVAEGDERARLGAYTSNYSSGHHDLARSNRMRLSILHGRALGAAGDLDAAVASLGDATKLAQTLGDDFAGLRAQASYELAGAYAQRADATSAAGDRRRAVEELRRAIDDGVVDRDVATWEEIKGETFRVLEQEPAYRELIRGR